MLSNDNAFLNYGDNAAHAFTQRTLVTRFSMNRTNTLETLRKPVANVMMLLALLQDELSLQVTGLGDPTTSPVGVIATVNRADAEYRMLGVLVYASYDGTETTANYSVTLTMTNLPAFRPNSMVNAYQLNNKAGSSFAAWQAQGMPVYPSAAEFAAMRLAMEVPQLPGYPKDASSLGSSVSFDMPAPGVVLLHACEQPANGPKAVRLTRLHVTPTPGQVMVSWLENADEQCLLTYKVLYAAARDGSMVNLVQRNTIFTSFVHNENGTVASGCYKVVAVDYWQRESQGSTMCVGDV